jgi:hypothetical protein
VAAALILTALGIAVGIAALLLGLWLLRTLKWEAIEDDQLEFRLPQGRSRARGWLKGLLVPRHRLLTYRRDRRGRFRRYRR